MRHRPEFNDLRLGRALQFSATLAKLNYDWTLALAELDSDRQLFSHIRQGVLDAKQWKRRQLTLNQVRGQRRRGRERAAEGSFTHAEWLTLCEQYDHHCAYCHQRFTRLTVDHFIPLSKGGSNHISNIRPACRSCNSRKGAKV